MALAAGQMLEGHYRGGRLGPRGLCLFPPQGSSRPRGEAAAEEGDQESKPSFSGLRASRETGSKLRRH